MATPFSDASFLSLLSEQVRQALTALPRDAAARHIRFLLGLHDGRGGFRGKRGASDLYYTAFAARALHSLGAFDAYCPEELRIPADQPMMMAAHAASCRPATVLDALNILATHAVTACPFENARNLLDWIERFRLPGAGYRKARGDSEGSLYHTFLAVLCYDLTGEQPPDCEALAEAALRHRQRDGGFSETLSHPFSSCNPTAAGLSLLTLLQSLDRDTGQSAADWLRTMQTPDGGWLAARHAPVSDLLSTYTAVLSLAQLDRISKPEMAPILRFLRTCQGSEGAGFSAGPWDATPDAEYTAYGLSLLGLAQGL